MNVHVQLDALARCDTVELGFQSFCFDTVSGRRTLVVLCARGCASTVRLIPMRGPIPVYVAAYATCLRSALSVLAPHAIGCLGVGEAVWVDDREDVEVVRVLERCGSGVG
jgi:hypothetical protein